MQAIFMVGEQRSGSNLLRLILNESESIAAPHPPHILQRLMPLVDAYGDLKNEGNFAKLIDNVCTLVELNPVPWEKIDKFDRIEVRERCLENNLVAVFGAVMDIYAEQHDANSWICKSMQNIRWANEINDYFTNSKYIYLYRDPRDVALSFTKAVIGEKHPYFIAQQWIELQELCLAKRNNMPEHQFFSIAYEDLTTKPEIIVPELCNFLDIDFNSKMLNFHNSNEAVRSAQSSQLWENLTKPIDSSNSKKFLKELPEEDIEIIESIAGDIMDELGYERAIVHKGKETRFGGKLINQFKQLNEQLKKVKSQETNMEDLKRRRRQTSFLEKISADKSSAIA